MLNSGTENIHILRQSYSAHVLIGFAALKVFVDETA